MWKEYVTSIFGIIIFSRLILGKQYCTVNCEDENCEITSQVNCTCGTYFIDFVNDTTLECKKKNKSKKTGVCLSYFLGWTGADMFYLGNGEKGSNLEYMYYGLWKLLTVGGGTINYFRDVDKIRNDEYLDGDGYELVKDYSMEFGDDEEIEGDWFEVYSDLQCYKTKAGPITTSNGRPVEEEKFDCNEGNVTPDAALISRTYQKKYYWFRTWNMGIGYGVPTSKILPQDKRIKITIRKCYGPEIVWQRKLFKDISVAHLEQCSCGNKNIMSLFLCIVICAIILLMFLVDLLMPFLNNNE